MERDVIMLQDPSGTDCVDGWDLPTSLGRFTQRLNSKYFPKFDASELRKALSENGVSKTSMFLQLTAICKCDSCVVDALYLKFVSDNILVDDPPEIAQKVLADYFTSIGYPGVACITKDTIAAFVERMAKDLPIINDYLVVQ